jgi:hypothetical protein
METPELHALWTSKINNALQNPGIADRVKTCIAKANHDFEEHMLEHGRMGKSRIKYQYDALVWEGLIVP